MAGVRRPVKGKMIAGAVAGIAAVGAIVAILGAVASGERSETTVAAAGAACPWDDGAAPPVPRVLQEWAQPCPLPGPLAFADGDGQPVSLEDFAGELVVLNLWATWCPPCVREMPSLDRLQQALGGEGVRVVALSQDRGGAAVSGAWLASQGLEALDVYADPRGLAGQVLRAPGLPTTVILDAQGREVARLLGDTDWDSPTMIARLRALRDAGAGAGAAREPGA